MILRSKKPLNYAELDGASEEDWIFCPSCGVNREGPCPREGHLVFRHDHRLEIGPSTIRDAGRGVFNASNTDSIPVGTVVNQ